jgi:hypothetical protein
VQIGDDYYWDGLFSANLPVDELIQQRLMGKGNIPDEAWIILINPITCKTVPTQPNEIVDRRNEMIGNVSVLRDLETLAVYERILEKKGFVEKSFKSTVAAWISGSGFDLCTCPVKSRTALTIPANCPAIPTSSRNSWKTEKGRGKNS